ncbi:MAG TPA: 30S ribosomal protein S18 [Myxococcales bacterium]|nr:30S ribosomal protein S18 [Myxococcales bacterium]
MERSMGGGRGGGSDMGGRSSGGGGRSYGGGGGGGGYGGGGGGGGYGGGEWGGGRDGGRAEGGRGGRGGGAGFGRRKVCRFCADKTAKVDYKDNQGLKFFLTERGKIIPRRISGNCAEHQRAVANAIKRARQLALLPYATIQG